MSMKTVFFVLRLRRSRSGEFLGVGTDDRPVRRQGTPPECDHHIREATPWKPPRRNRTLPHRRLREGPGGGKTSLERPARPVLRPPDRASAPAERKMRGQCTTSNGGGKRELEHSAQPGSAHRTNSSNTRDQADPRRDQERREQQQETTGGSTPLTIKEDETATRLAAFVGVFYFLGGSYRHH